MVTAPADVARVQAWARQSDRVAVIDAMAELIGIDLRETSTLDRTRAVYERQYRTLAGVRIAMSPAGRHFIMLDDPAWFEATIEAFIQ